MSTLGAKTVFDPVIPTLDLKTVFKRLYAGMPLPADEAVSLALMGPITT
jgi:hypothetical protein